MAIRIALLLLLAVSANAIADAGAGEFMGYRLGGRYQRGPVTSLQVTTTGNLVIIAESPVKPADIAEVAVVTTPATLTIGNITASQWFPTEDEARGFARRYFELLRARYPAWPFGWEVMDARMRIVEVSFHQPPYNLQLRLAADVRSGKGMWRFSMALGWLPDSAEAKAWQQASGREQTAVRKADDQVLLKQSDVRGL